MVISSDLVNCIEVIYLQPRNIEGINPMVLSFHLVDSLKIFSIYPVKKLRGNTQMVFSASCSGSVKNISLRSVK